MGLKQTVPRALPARPPTLKPARDPDGSFCTIAPHLANSALQDVLQHLFPELSRDLSLPPSALKAHPGGMRVRKVVHGPGACA